MNGGAGESDVLALGLPGERTRGALPGIPNALRTRQIVQIDSTTLTSSLLWCNDAYNYLYLLGPEAACPGTNRQPLHSSPSNSSRIISGGYMYLLCTSMSSSGYTLHVTN